VERSGQALDRPMTPAVSVVMVTHGGGEWPARALAALHDHTTEPFEAIVVDNASPDGLVDGLQARFPSIVVIRNEDNTGFGPACNQGAERAHAPVLAFVNSDALVGPGWLAPLLAALAEPGVAAAGPMLLNQDGTLQEAGALVAADGVAAGYGDGDDAEALPYRFRRLVDYASAACLLVRRDAFGAMGGFDPVYAPAYYEDSDLCFRLRAAGHRIVYVPTSRVTHVRYGSSGSERARALSDRNRATFVARFATELDGRPRRLTGRAGLAARDANALPRVLVLGTRELALAVAERWPLGRTTLHLADAGDVQPLLDAGVEVATGTRGPWLSSRRLHYDAVLSLDLDPSLEDELDETQPGACRALPPGARRADVVLDGDVRLEALADAGLA
jgi:GT2 family glycosyltransferase